MLPLISRHNSSIFWSLFLIILWTILCVVYSDNVITSTDNGNTTKFSKDSKAGSSKQFRSSGSVLGKCTRCRLLSNSIYEIIKNITITNNEFNADFLTDFEKLNKIKKQIPFSKVWDKLCFDIKAGRDDCRSLAEDNFAIISNWWKIDAINSKAQTSNNIIFDMLCIDGLKVCCPEGHFGPDCLPCIGYPAQICSNNGKCAGDGTRLGNGHCACKKGYQGEDCGKCDKTFYLNESVLNENVTVQCLPCDNSCAETCFAAGPRGCHVCKNGYAWDNELGCIDVDECAPGYPSPCSSNSFCINTDGSFQCYQCDQACNGCEGDGPDSCTKCAENHVLKEGICVNPNPEPIFPPYASPARYITYLGLCFVTCIIFRHNILVASAIGLAVALYIMASERSLDTEHGRSMDNWLKKFTGEH